MSMKQNRKRRNRNKKRRDIGNKLGVILILRKDFKKLMDYTMYFLEGAINCSDVEVSQRAKELAPHLVSIWERVKVENIDPDHIMTIIQIRGEEDRKKYNECLSNSGSYTIGVSGQAFELIELAGKEIEKEKSNVTQNEHV
ncbi:hypothetical protein MUP77_25900 [Candidatus Bathyarchaeota archaeon]|nr:hypothetical protein [Candidatus Bathyarchaeota archaeon]